ncbi:hypothetical protein [Agromyces sp. CCNWLW203]|uniref:hypothetical protein n=1 Tax=Agromyces sp. CCNWLW203 TaxID=3112842 RepID=UPI002F96E182
MSDGATTGIDPRFDPRYQRGYNGHGAAGSAADAAAPTRRSVASVPDPSRPAPEAIRSPAVAPDRRIRVGAPPADPARNVSPAEVDTPRPRGELPVDWFDDVGASPALQADHSFAAAWAVSALAAVLGVALFWAGVSNETFRGPVSEADRWLAIAAWNVAPALVQAGLLGVVGMLVWSGVRRARAGSGAGGSNRPPLGDADGGVR